MGMVKFVIRRLLIAAATLFVVLATVFFALQLLPGGYATIILGPRATEQARAALEAKYGLDQPVVVQFFHWLGSALQGDLGVSLVSKTPVVDELARRMPATLQIMLVAIVFAIVVGIVLGLLSGLSGRRKVVQGATRFFGIGSLSAPDFVIGTVLLYLASVGAWGLTGKGFIPFSQDPGASLAATLLPSITLGLGGVAIVMRTLRDSVASTLTEPYISSAVARGDKPRTIVFRHVLRNSAAPSVNVIALLFGTFIGGTVVVETLFSIPGMGLFFANSVRSRDFAVVQGVVLISATVFIVANMLADIAHVLLDPRLARQRSASR
jgi:peptide/nickel transport system permease protein